MRNSNLRVITISPAVFLTVLLTVGCGVDTGETPSQPDPASAVGPEGKPVSSQYGLSTILDNGNQAIFFDSKGSTLAKLQTALGGGLLNEQWFIIELPADLMPADNETKVYELNSKAGIKLTMRHMFSLYGNKHWQTHVFHTATPGVDGHLHISGSNVVATTKKITLGGTLLGAGFQFYYKGPMDIAGNTVPSELDIGQGFLFMPQQ